MEYKYLITLDNTRQTQKPKKTDVNKISNNVAIQTGLTINEMATYMVQPYSYTWCPSFFKGNRDNENWLGQGVFALDFDKGTPPDEILNRFHEFNIKPNIFYTSFSDTPELRKFRLVFVLDSWVSDYDGAQYIRNSLKYIFPEADKQCFDAARMFFGGLQSQILNPDPIPFEKFINFIEINVITKDRNQTRKIAEKGVNLYNIYNNTHNSANDSNTTSIVDPDQNEHVINTKENDFDFERCEERVRIYREFVAGKWLNQDEIFGLATNLHCTKGGAKRMNEIMTKYNQEGITHYTENNFNTLPYVKKRRYKPMKLENFSPYPEDHEYMNLITAVRMPRGMIEIISDHKKIDLQSGELLFQQKFSEILDRKDTKIYIFKVPTSLGKTEMLSYLKDATLSFPTHDLIEEVDYRMKVEHVKTPEMPKFFDEKLKNKMAYFYTSGLNSQVHKQLKEMAFDKDGKLFNRKDIKLATDYLRQNEIALRSKQTVLTTHIKALLNDFPHDTLVFDEDPLDNLIDIKRLDTRDLYAVNCCYFNQEATIAALDFIAQIKPGEIAATPEYKIDEDRLIQSILASDVSSNLIQFFYSKYFIKDERHGHFVHYVTKRELPPNKKVIIMSATIAVPIYKTLYGDRVEVIDISNIKNKGYVEQHTDRSFSRASLSKVESEDLKTMFEGKPVITFQSYSDKINTENIRVHYGNCEGYDSFNGRDIVVLGTPHLNNVVYSLYGKILGLNVDGMDTKMRYQKIEWNGFKFMFMCYSDKELRDIQMSLIESELVQAVGRARTLRSDATVHVYSNLPLAVADKFVY